MTNVAVANRPLRARVEDFLDYLDEWMEGLTPLPLAGLVAEAGGPEHVGIFCVDVINGFCHEGPLRSNRVQAIIAPIVELFKAADAGGIRHFVLTRDAHDPAAAEFADYPPHCIRGTGESEIVPELMALPFASRYTIIPKNSIHSAVGTELNPWLDAHPEVTHRIVVGDCTDLCTYQLAMHLKVRANAANRADPVILPVNCVDTYDVPVSIARAEDIPAHPADLFHAVYLYSMAHNGIRVVAGVDRSQRR
jgi:nicotinamidase-related amidase